MFKWASVDGKYEDESIDIGERLAPFVHADLSPDQREQIVGAPPIQPPEPCSADSPIALHH